MTMKHRRHGVGVRVPRREDSRDLAGPELRYRQHARVEDRIRELKATGLTNVPCQSLDSNAAWLGIVLAATDLVAGSQLIGFTDHPRSEQESMRTKGSVTHVDYECCWSTALVVERCTASRSGIRTACG